MKDSLFVRLMLRTRLNAETGCWNWTGNHSTAGYGRICINEAWQLAHRMMYAQIKGPIPAGLGLDHLCRNRQCLNPSHLEPVTQTENHRRGNAGHHNGQKTKCKHGHPLSGPNVWISIDGRRYCTTCDRLRRRAKAAKLKAAAEEKARAAQRRQQTPESETAEGREPHEA